ncbi:MAG: roadblock/LC7 domain-containing protein [Candidatus Odinarchaeota archaeon]|nr:roadblock/LC7 domain-containing protein [Candidatus Odinarchaeota archaeon]
MNATNNDKIKKILKKLKENNPDLESVVLSGPDGIVIDAILPSDEDPLLMSALVASILMMSKKSVEKVKKGLLKRVLIEGEEGSILVIQTKNNSILGCVLKKKAKIGLAMIELKRAADKIDEILGEG